MVREQPGSHPPGEERAAPALTLAAPFADLPGWLRVSPSLGKIRQLEVAAVALLGLLAGITAAAASGLFWVGAATVPVVIVGWVLGTIYMRRRVGSWAYLERDQDLLVRRGVMFRRLSVVPYGRMQTVDVTAGPLERAFRLATVRLHTASMATDARIPGLPSLEAARLRDRLASLGEAEAEGL